MERQWEMYTREIQGSIALVFYDHDLRTQVPIPGKEHLVNLLVKLKDFREDGLPHPEDQELLVRMDLDMETYEKRADGIYLGRVIHDGRLAFYFYSGKPAPSHRLFLSLIESKYGLPCELQSTEDPEGTTYHEYLFPDPFNWLMIQNAHNFDYLASQGDSLERERRIDHWLYFQSEKAREAFIEELKSEGFDIDSVWEEPPSDEGDNGAKGSDAESESESESDASEGDFRYGVRMYHIDRPEFTAMTDLTCTLMARSLDSGGHYHRWQSEIVRS